MSKETIGLEYKKNEDLPWRLYIQGTEKPVRLENEWTIHMFLSETGVEESTIFESIRNAKNSTRVDIPVK